MTRPRAEDFVAGSSHDFDPFQALRVLLLDRPRGLGGLGDDTPPALEAVRVRTATSHNFAASPIQSVNRPIAAEDQRNSAVEVTVNFMGAFGAMGVLPRQHTDLLTRAPKDAAPLRAFLDLFNHRVISLFYRAWRKYRLAVEYERSRLDPDTKGESDTFSTAFRSLAGVGLPRLRNRLAFDDEVLLWFSGHFSHPVPKTDSLRQMLRECVGSGVEVEPLRGVWAELAPVDRTRLGLRSGPGLGGGQVLGARVWIVQSRFRVRLGPLTLDEFRSYSPGGESLIPMAEFVRAYVGPALDYDVQPVLLASDAPRPRLTRRPERRLGVDTWLLTRTATHDLDDAVFRPSGWPRRYSGKPYMAP